VEWPKERVSPIAQRALWTLAHIAQQAALTHLLAQLASLRLMLAPRAPLRLMLAQAARLRVSEVAGLHA